MKKISKEDRFRLEFLSNLMIDLLQKREKFSSIPYKFKSLYSMLETLEDNQKQHIFEFWGEFEQIYAGMLANNRDELTETEMKDFKEISKQAKEYCDLLLEAHPSEPEDPYAWPFEEYK